MNPHVLFVGADSKGSWQVRGVQMARALGARATLKPTRDDWRWADVVVLVKRAIDAYGAEARKVNVPVIWDALDFWKQPEDHAQPLTWHRGEVRRRRQQYELAQIIGATKQMAEDVGGVYIPHHSRPGLKVTPIRPEATVVAYEGVSKYLAQWKADLAHACKQLGLTFVVNPESLSQADIIVSFRGGQWNSDICERWKSGVKYVNAIAAGRPVLTMHCSAAHEIKPFGRIVEQPDLLQSALRAMTPEATRQMCFEVSQKRAAEFSLESVAKQYRAVVSRVLEKVAA